MRKTFFGIIAVAFCALMLSSCEKDEAKSEFSSHPGSRLVSYELKSCLPAGEAVNELLDEFEEIEAPVCFDIDLEKVGIQLKAYRIVYNTADVKGNQIQLSGDVCYIDCGLGNERILESVSLFHTAFATSEEYCCAYEQYAFIGRSVHNALVVYPHYQGFHAGRDLPVTVQESLLKARQAIDCEIAALELVEKLEDVSMMPCYYTENMSISNGVSAALATEYLLENDKDLKVVDRDFIHLRSTYCCAGPYKYSELITYFANNDAQENIEFSQVAFLSLIVGAYETWKGIKDGEGNEYFADIEDVREYFNPGIFNRDDLIYEDGTVVKDPVQFFLDGKLDHMTDMFEDAGVSAKDMMNPKLMLEDGKLNEDNPLVVALFDAMAVNEVIASGWSPKAPLTISHSISDELVPYSQAKSVYESLSDNGQNPLVNFKSICGLKHTKANVFFAISDLVLKKHPVEFRDSPAYVDFLLKAQK